MCAGPTTRIYQLPFILLQRCTLPDKRCLSHGICLYQVMVTFHFLNDAANEAALRHNMIFASCESEQLIELINRLLGSRLLISSLPGSASRTHVESLGKPRDVNKRSLSLAW